MQNTVSALPYFFALIILIGILWMVVQKVFARAGLYKRSLVNEKNDVDGSDNTFNQQTPSGTSETQQTDINLKCGVSAKTSNTALHVGEGSFISGHYVYDKNPILNSESLMKQYLICKSKQGVGMTFDTDTTMTEPNSTNYTFEGGTFKKELFSPKL